MVYEFDDCVLDSERYVLHRAGEKVALEPQVFDVLTHLLRNAGRVVTRDELFDEVWGTRFVSEASLTSRIRAARRAVGDSGSKQAVIRTVRNRGYEFIAAVVEHATQPQPSRSAQGVVADADPAPGERATDQARVAPGLPAVAQDLIGRDELLRELERELELNRLVTLIGPGGVGKTSVAYELARSLDSALAEEVFAVEFVEVRDAAATVQALATALDVQTRRDISLEDAVVNVLKPRRALLVLDNCEHVVEPLARVVDRVFQAAPRVTVLATSRQPLAVRGERLWPIEPLAVGELDGEPTFAELRALPAVRLFSERAAAVAPRFELDESTIESVVSICRRLDGMPLAIELAAARVRTLGLRELEERLSERFRLLRNVRRGGDPRHHALQDTVEWSYDLLSAEEQKLFDELSIFAGQFDLRAAAAVCGGRDELDALDLVTSLAERSMLVVRQAETGGARYELLETLREYGGSRLDASARTALRAQHASFYAGLAREVERAQHGSDERQALASAHAAFPDLRAAQSHAVQEGNVDRAFTLVSALREYGMRAMRYEALGWAEAALAVDGASEHHLFPTVLGVTAYRAWLRGEFDQALELAERVSAEERSRGETTCGLAQRVHSNVRYAQGQIDEGLVAGREQLRLAEEAEHPSRIVHAAYMMSVALSFVGERDEARELASRALAIGEETYSATDLASAWAAHGFASQDDVPAALEAFARSAQLAAEVGNRWMSTFARTEASALQLVQGELREASSGLADAVDTWYRAGEWSQQWITLALCVAALVALEESELAAELAGAVERRAALISPPVTVPLRERTSVATEELRQTLGDERYEELHAQGAEAPVVDVVHRTRAALLGGALQ